MPDPSVALQMDLRLMGFFAAHLEGFLSHLPRLSVTQRCLVIRLLGFYASLYLNPPANSPSGSVEAEAHDKMSTEAKSVLSNLNDDSQSESAHLVVEQNRICDRISFFLKRIEELLALDCFQTKREVFRFFLKLNETDLVRKNLPRIVTHLNPTRETRLAKRGYMHASKINQRFSRSRAQQDWFAKFESQSVIQCFEFLLEANEQVSQDCASPESLFEDHTEFLTIGLADTAYMKVLKLKALSTLRSKKNTWIFEKEFKKTLNFLEKEDCEDSKSQNPQKQRTQTDCVVEQEGLPHMLRPVCFDALAPTGLHAEKVGSACHLTCRLGGQARTQ